MQAEGSLSTGAELPDLLAGLVRAAEPAPTWPEALAAALTVLAPALGARAGAAFLPPASGVGPCPLAGAWPEVEGPRITAWLEGRGWPLPDAPRRIDPAGTDSSEAEVLLQPVRADGETLGFNIDTGT